MARYIKLPTVVEAEQSGAQRDWGFLGNLVTTDWILLTCSGEWHTMNDTTFQSKYTMTSPSTPLTGSDWD